MTKTTEVSALVETFQGMSYPGVAKFLKLLGQVSAERSAGLMDDVFEMLPPGFREIRTTDPLDFFRFFDDMMTYLPGQFREELEALEFICGYLVSEQAIGKSVHTIHTLH